MLTVDPIVNVNVDVAASVTAVTTYDVGLIVAPVSEAITAATRAKVYTSLTGEGGVETDFASTSDVYAAAAKYFGVVPTPKSLVVGVAADGETPAQTLEAIRNIQADWYGVYWIGADDTKKEQIDEYLINAELGLQFATTTGASVTAVTANTALAARLAAKASKRTVLMYSQTPVEAAAVMGMAMGCANQYAGTTWQLAYKEINGLTPVTVSQEERNRLNEAGISVYVLRMYTRKMFEVGATPSGLRADEVIALDRIAAGIQDVCLSLIAGNIQKLPQNDTTTTRFISAITEVMEAYAAIGYIQRGVWTGASFGNIVTGDVLEKGYAMWADSFDNQAGADRRARMGMPISVALCLCGSVESVVINVTVQE